MIKAEAHSDDHVFEVEFDASGWFLQATDDEILELANDGFGGDYSSDAVAQHMAGTVEELADLFKYLERIANIKSKKDVKGFECNIDPNEALAWVRANRPHLAGKIQRCIDGEED